MEDPADQGVTWVGYPLEVLRVLDSVYLDQAERDFLDYVRRTLAASQSYGGRYNASGEFGALYTASDELTAWLEVAARYERQGIVGLPPTMGFIGLVVSAGRYVDLTDEETRGAWDADIRALISEKPSSSEEEHCWNVGRTVRAVADFLMAPSARAEGANIPLFPDRENGELRYSLRSVQRGRVPRDLVQQAGEEW